MLVGLFYGVLFVLGLILYFLPSIIAEKRMHDSENLILLLNFIIGWTFIGWIALIVWACEGKNNGGIDE